MRCAPASCVLASVSTRKNFFSAGIFKVTLDNVMPNNSIGLYADPDDPCRLR